MIEGTGLTDEQIDKIRSVSDYRFPAKELALLLDAVWQVLDDMGIDGQSCCLAAKAQLRIAYEPFRENDLDVDYTLEAAQEVIDDINNAYRLIKIAQKIDKDIENNTVDLTGKSDEEILEHFKNQRKINDFGGK